jgi:hypothetical protein
LPFPRFLRAGERSLKDLSSIFVEPTMA